MPEINFSKAWERLEYGDWVETPGINSINARIDTFPVYFVVELGER